LNIFSVYCLWCYRCPVGADPESAARSKPSLGHVAFGAFSALHGRLEFCAQLFIVFVFLQTSPLCVFKHGKCVHHVGGGFIFNPWNGPGSGSSAALYTGAFLLALNCHDFFTTL